MQLSSRPPCVAIASSSGGGGSKMPACNKTILLFQPLYRQPNMHTCSTAQGT